MSSKHSDATLVHRLHRWVFADETARLAGLETVVLTTALVEADHTLNNSIKLIPDEIVYFSSVPVDCGLSTAIPYYVIAGDTPLVFKLSLTLGGTAIALSANGSATINKVSVSFSTSDIGKRAYQADTKAFWDIVDVVSGVPEWYANTTWATSYISDNVMHETTGGIDFHSAVFVPPMVSSIEPGVILSFLAAGSSYLSSPTFTPNAGVIPEYVIKRFDSAAGVFNDLAVDDITVDCWYNIQFNDNTNEWILLNPSQSIIGTATQTALDLKLDIIDANKHLTIIDETGGVIVVNTENNSLPIIDETGATLFVDLVVSDQETVHTFTTYTASHALILADSSTISNSSPIVEMNVATANTLTVPPNSSVEFVIGSKIDAVQIGAGQTTITPGSGVTIYGTPGLKLRAQYSGVTLIKKAINTWYALGDLSA